MIAVLIFVSMMAVGIFGQSDTNTLADILSVLDPSNLFDGPPDISHAITTNTATKSPNVTNLQYYNYYAASMYCSDQLANLSCAFCQNFKNDVNVNDIAVLSNSTYDSLGLVTVSNSRQEIVVTFRGSDTILNYIEDFEFFDTNLNGIKVHSGFYIVTMSLYDDVVSAVAYQQLIHPQYKIVLVGHSLGAAVARLTLYFLLTLNQFDNATYELYTYGEPRVGNQPFADYFNELDIISARVVNQADIVPHLAPTSFLGTTLLYDYYIQAHAEVWIQSSNGSNQLRFSNLSFYEDPSGSDSLDPEYTTDDHFTYFGLNYQACGASNPLLPFNITNPNDLPPLPTLITDLLAGLVFFISTLLVGLLGGLLSAL